jgi:hypothetical protein
MLHHMVRKEKKYIYIYIYILKHKAHVLRRRSLKEKVATKCLINTLIEGTNREEKRYIIK